MTPPLDKLTPVIRNYAWGSHSAIAELTGRSAPTPQPEAELWMGAHEDSPSGLERDGATTTLDAVVASDPIGELGQTVVTHFNGRLPFLLKVLAPEVALSIQAHPTREQALGAARGTYIDDWAKPEAVLALTPYELFAGCLPFDQVQELAQRVGSPAYTALVERSAATERPVQALLRSILIQPADERQVLVEEVTEAAQRETEHPQLAAIARISEDFPGDIGLVVLLTMGYLVVQPGNYLFIPPGVLHSAVRGVVIEILGNSDNVVRAGLTPKKIDIPELLRIVDVDRRVSPEEPESGERVHSFPVDVPHFQLHRVLPGAEPVLVPGRNQPRILLCLNGSIEITQGEHAITLGPGESCFVAASSGEVRCCGDGTAYVATTGLLH